MNDDRQRLASELSAEWATRRQIYDDKMAQARFLVSEEVYKNAAFLIAHGAAHVLGNIMSFKEGKLTYQGAKDALASVITQLDDILSIK